MYEARAKQEKEDEGKEQKTNEMVGGTPRTALALVISVR